MGNAQRARQVLQYCARAGVAEYIVCAGARNIPFLVPLLQACEAPGSPRVFHHFEERAAAFFALGRIKRLGRPVAVVTTSGTAAAELLPAMIEAHYSGLPLLALTADRPANFRGTGAPQAIEQVGLFGPYATAAWDVRDDGILSELGGWGGTGPAHLNVCFDEPGPEQNPDVEAMTLANEPASGDSLCVEDEPPDALLEFLKRAERLVVLLGELTQEEASNLEPWLRDLGAPIWAEAASHLRESDLLAGLRLKSGEAILRDLRPAQVLRLGGVPSCRYWRDLENEPSLEVCSVSRTGFSGLARPSLNLRAKVSAIGELPDSRAMGDTKAMLPQDEKAAWGLEALFQEYPHSEPTCFRRLSGIIPNESLVFLGNSLPIREWNLAATAENRKFRCFANRGANGIDGQLSTFLGCSMGEEAESWGIFGDLTALYDTVAPWMLEQMTEGVCRIVIVNNEGGQIFSRLPAVAGQSGRVRQTIENRHAISFQKWAEWWGLEYLCWRGDGWAPPEGRHAVIEIRPDAEESEAFWKALPDIYTKS